MRKMIRPVTVALLLASSFLLPAAASGAPYRGYEFNDRSQSVAAPVGYLPEREVFGSALKIEPKPGNIQTIKYSFADPEHPALYMLDCGNNRIIKTDESLNVISWYDGFDDISSAKDLAVSAGGEMLYIADPANGKVSVAGFTGKTTAAITAAEAGVKFAPFAVEADGNDTLYILDEGRRGGYYKVEAGDKPAFVPLPGANLTSLTYNQETGCVYALDAGRREIVNLTDDESIPLEGGVSAKSKFTTDFFGTCFYVADTAGTTVRKFDEFGSLDSTFTCENSGRIAGIATNGDRERLIVSHAGDFGLSVYGSKNEFLYSKDALSFELVEPTDMAFDGKDGLYILDSGLGRVLKLDTQLNTVTRATDCFAGPDGKILKIKGALGFAIDGAGNYYIADTENYRVLITDFNGNVKAVILRPNENLHNTDAPFRATKVLVGRKQEIYVITDTINLGAFVFDSTGKFQSFYGATTVTKTAQVLLNYIRKKFLTREQLRGIEQYTPIALANLTMDRDGFIYTVREVDQRRINTDVSSLIQKLNYKGKNILTTRENIKGFGDLDSYGSPVVNTSFSAISVDSDGFINVVDKSRGKVFQYSKDGQMLTAFGGIGTQTGLFSEPCAIESIDGRIYVLDRRRGCIVTFAPTEYMAALRKAVLLTDSSDSAGALEAWNAVLNFNTNSQYSFYGAGMAYEMAKEYHLAMESYRKAGAKAEYSKAFREYRKEYLAQNAWWLILALLTAVAGVIIALRLVSKKLRNAQTGGYSALENKWGLPVYVLTHPADGFEQFRTRKLHSIKIAFGLAVAWFLLRVFEFFCTGFTFNPNRPVDYNLFATLVPTVGVFFLFVMANWALTTFLDGKGRLSEILCVTAYSLIPMLAAMLITTILSNFLTSEEQAFIGIMMMIGYIWSGLLLIIGFSTVHQYSIIKTVVSILLTVLGVAIIALTLILCYSLILQLTNFIESLVMEWKMR